MSDENTVVVNGKRRRQRVEVFALGEFNTILAHSGGINSYTELPGGGVNVNETIIEAGIRELAEEAGWLITNPRLLTVPGDNTFVENDNSWLMQHGYDEEDNYTIVCNVIKHKPDERYNSEGDAKEYKLTSINQVINETKETAERSTDKRGRYISEYRLRAMNVLFNLHENVSMESRPNWINWKL